LIARAADDATAATFTLTAGAISLGDRARIASSNASSLSAGEVSITADSVEIENQASVLSETSGGGGGAALRIDAALLDQATGERIESDTIGTGVGGDIEINSNTVELRGDSASSDPGGVFARSLGSGASGSLSIDADEVSVGGGAQVSATAEGAGRREFSRVRGLTPERPRPALAEAFGSRRPAWC
jgi:hypothetical protein